MRFRLPSSETAAGASFAALSRQIALLPPQSSDFCIAGSAVQDIGRVDEGLWTAGIDALFHLLHFFSCLIFEVVACLILYLPSAVEVGARDVEAVYVTRDDCEKEEAAVHHAVPFQSREDHD